jgi:P4 family phage/plasmid primase-like protien
MTLIGSPLTNRAAFLRALLGDRPEGAVLYVAWNAPASGESKTWCEPKRPCSSVEEAVAVLAAHAERAEVYARLAWFSPGHGGKKAAVVARRVLSLDLDDKAMPGATPEEKHRHARSLADAIPGPKILVDSGGGFHVHVLLPEEQRVESFPDPSEGVAHFAVLGRALRLFVEDKARTMLGASVSLDPTHTVERAWRVPPGSNMKAADGTKALTPDSTRWRSVRLVEPEPEHVEAVAPASLAFLMRYLKAAEDEEDAKGRTQAGGPAPALNGTVEFDVGLLPERLRGKWPIQGGDQSKHDFAVACALAERGCDDGVLAAAIHARRALTGSVKGERADYVPRTVAKARRAVASVGTRKAASIEAGRERCTDLGNARRLVRRAGERIRFARGRGWFAWDGRRWAPDVTGEVMRLAKEAVESIFDEARAAGATRQAEELAKWAVRSQDAPRLDALLKVAQTERAVALDPAAFDKDSWLLNVENGTLDLRTGNLREHRQGDLITRLSPVAFDRLAEAPRWRAFLDRVLPDPEVQRFVQRLVGYWLTGDTSEQVVVILYGTGANGKTVFVEAVRDVLGNYAASTPFDSFLARRTTGQPRDDLARLDGARLVTAAEPSEGARLDEGVVKALTGADTVTARHLYGTYFDFRPTFKIVLTVNHRPHITGTDLGIWRRVRLVPFTVTIAEKDQDRELAARLCAEAPGILRWAVEGCRDRQAHGLGTPGAVCAATAAYREDEDTLGPFLVECCTLGPERRVTAKDLHAAYQRWCQENGEEPVSQKVLGSRLSQRPGLSRKRSGKWWWHGVGLTQSVGPLDPCAPSNGKLLHTPAREEVPSRKGLDGSMGPSAAPDDVDAARTGDGLDGYRAQDGLGDCAPPDESSRVGPGAAL